ncbi:MAG: hypothetical protein F6K19_49440, partial [Cyanothece sp. SIO1E1]|nr:hypothetical protein [Cyanothece sp. SIO1E1]
ATTAATGTALVAVTAATLAAAPALAPLAVAAGGTLLTAGVITSYNQRSQEASRAGLSNRRGRIAAAAAGDVLGVSPLIEGVTGNSVVTGKKLSEDRQSEQLGTGLGGLALAAAGNSVARAATKAGRGLNGPISRLLDDTVPSNIVDDAAGALDNVASNIGGLDDIPLVTNKFPQEALDPAGKVFGEVQALNGRVSLGGREIPRNVDFVITSDNRLILGSKHTTLSNGADVRAAGQLKIDGSGRIRRIDNGSGHFRPTVEEASRVPDLLRAQGLDLKGARFLTRKFRINADGLIVGPPETVINKVLD